MAGDGQNGALDTTKGATDKNHTVLHINLVDLSGEAKPGTPAKAPEGNPLHVAQARGANGRLLGPGTENPYKGDGGGVAKGFHLPDGSRPQDTINQNSGQPGSPTVTNWNTQRDDGQKRLDDLARRNKAQNEQGINAVAPKAAPRDRTTGADGENLHVSGVLDRGLAVVAAATYAQFGHPIVQRAAVPAQLKADAANEAGNLSTLSKIGQYPRKAYLEAFSPTYNAQTELARILPMETAAKKHLAALRVETEENIEALKLNKAGRAKLETLAGSSPTTQAGIDEAARAQRQVDYLEAFDKSKLKKTTVLADESKKLEFLDRNNKFVAGGTVSEGSSLNWSGMKTAMQDANVFAAKDMKPVAEIAAKEEPYVSIAGKMMSRGELEAVAKATEAGKGFWGTTWSFSKKAMVAGTVVGAESWAQSSMAVSLADSGHTSLARIIEPTVPGAFAKASAVILGSSLKTKGYAYLGAQAYEAEANMTHGERFVSMAVGLVPAAIAFARKDKPLATTLAVADLAIGVAAELTDDFIFKNDKTISHSAKAITDIASNPSDVSRSTLKDGVSEMKETGKENPFLLTQNYDAAHSDKMAVTPQDAAGVIGAQAKYKAQMIIGQAQGETILDNGLTQSQYLKMQDRNAQVVDPSDHKEQYRIAPSERIDIGGQAARTLIGAIGSANLLEWATVKGKGSTDGIEAQKQGMKDELNDLFNKPHPHQIENALKESSWGFGKTVNDYSLVEFWKHNNFDYAHIHDTIRNNADYYANTALPQMKTNLDKAQASLDQATQHPASDTDVAEKQKLFDARRDALGLTTAWVGKLYRDQALMKIGQIQYMLQDSHDGHTVTPDDIKPQLELVAIALANANKYAPNNPDGKQLESMTATMYEQEKLVPPTDFRPNH